MGSLRVVVTRSADESAPWLEALRAAGFEPVALPLIEIGPPLDAAALAAARGGLAAYGLAVFVSGNAVRRFFADGATWPDGLQAAAPGPATAQALRDAGVPAARVVEPAPEPGAFDSEALWERLRAADWHGVRVLVVRGEGGRDWLVERLAAAGARVDTVAAYARRAPAVDAAARAIVEAALAAPRSHAWLFASGEAATNLQRLHGHARWRASRAVVTHARIAERVRELGFGEVAICRPDPGDVVATLRVPPG